MAIFPTPGALGAWNLKPPFDTKLKVGLAYLCKEVRLITEMVAQGVNVREQFYAANGLSNTFYEEDLKDGAAIVTLTTSSGDRVFVPSPYILGWPSADGVPYAVVAMAIVLGALPNTVDPTFLTNKVSEVIHSNLGLMPEISYATVSEVTVKSQEQHNAAESGRLSNISENKTNFQLLEEANARIAALVSENQALANYIAEHIPPPPGP